MQAAVELAQRIAARSGEIEGVIAVALGGSWARGEARSGSDVDLGIYYRDEHRPSIEELHRARGDAFYVTGCLFRCAACMVQVLFALNERYIINEKGSVEAADSLPLRPANFKEIINSVLARPGERPEQLESSVRSLEDLLEAVEGLCAPDLSERTP